MIIKYDDLVELLSNHPAASEVSPRQALYLQFSAEPRKVKDTVTYHSTDESIVVIDIDEEGKVLGIEIV
jgi:hypothetical protein